MTCELCIREHRSRWYYEGDTFCIFDCDHCGIPMLVTNKHIMHPSEEFIKEMKKKACELFGTNIEFRTQQQKIRDHWHWHIIIPQTPA